MVFDNLGKLQANIYLNRDEENRFYDKYTFMTGSPRKIQHHQCIALCFLIAVKYKF